MAFSGTEMPTAAKRMYCPIYVLSSRRMPHPEDAVTWAICYWGPMGKMHVGFLGHDQPLLRLPHPTSIMKL